MLARRFSLAFILYLVALSIRIVGISPPALMGDEFFWNNRSRQIIYKLRAGEFSTATTHLKHPGIPPAFTLGVGQEVGKKINKLRGKNEGEPGAIDRTTAGRTSNAVVASLIAPAIYLGTLPLIGTPSAVVAALLVACDPYHIALSRVVHLDGMYSLFVTITLLLFAAAVSRNSLPLKLAAGLGFGLCIATKPTSATLVISFLLYKSLRMLLTPREKNTGEQSYLNWSDVWAVIVAHAFLGSIYTRLWVRVTDTLGRFVERPSLVADLLYGSGTYLQQHLGFSSLLLAVVFLGSIFLYRKRTRAYFHLSMFGFVAVTLLSALTIAPQVVENLARYWTFAAGLAEEKHDVWGEWRPPIYGYLEFFARMLPALAVFGAMASLTLLVRAIRNLRQTKNYEFVSFWALTFIATLLWVLPLNATEKQDYRYAVPILPTFYIFVSIGLVEFVKLLGRAASSVAPNAAGMMRTTCYSILGVYLGLLVYDWHPNYQVFYNSIFGGITEAKAHHLKFQASGHNEILRELHEHALRVGGGVKNVYLTGEGLNTVRVAYERLYPKEERVLKIDVRDDLLSYDYLLVFCVEGTILDKTTERFHTFTKLSPVHSFKIKKETLVKAFSIDLPDYLAPTELNLGETAFHTGAREEKDKSVYAVPGRHRSGYLVAGNTARIGKGTYLLKASLSVPQGITPDPALTPERYALRLDFGTCEQIATLKNVLEGAIIEVECNSEIEKRVAIAGWWFGTVPVKISKLEIVKKSP